MSSPSSRRPPLSLRAPCNLLIGGAWRPAADLATLAVVNPGTGETVASVACAGEADVCAAVAAAASAFAPGSPWRSASARDRAAALERLASLLERDGEYVAQLEALNAGRPIAVARSVDAATAPQVLRYFAGWCDKISGSALPVAGAAAGGLAFTQAEPIGVVAAILPFNFPLLSAVAKLAPALAAGCTVVIKPAEQTPLSALHLGALAVEAGLPPGVVGVLPGDRATGAALARHAGVAKVSFTGSPAAGAAIARGAAATMQRVTLELGGKNACIILPGADVSEAARIAVGGNFFNAGQICVAISRVFVPESLLDAFLAAAAARARARTVGDQWSGADMGPLASAAALQRVQGYVDAGVREGARLVCGGRRWGEVGFFVEPTIFAGVTDDMAIAREEIFGPVMSVLSYKDDDVRDAVRRANASPYGLAASVVGCDVGQAVAVANALCVGTVWINSHGVFDPSACYGGAKASGIGKEYGIEGLQAYLHTKTVMIALPAQAVV